MVEVLLYGPVHGPVLPLVRASTSASALRRGHDVADFTSAVKRQTYPWKQRTVLLLSAFSTVRFVCSKKDERTSANAVSLAYYVFGYNEYRVRTHLHRSESKSDL